MTPLYNLDVEILLFINRTLQNSLFDFILPAVTDLHKIRFIQLAILAIWLVLLKFNRNAFLVGLGLIFSLALGDFLGGQLKGFFLRPRPDLAGIDVILRAPHFGGGAFPSNHALNMFCLYQFISFFYSKAKLYLLFFALIIAFSRVYCGVHYPSDVISGGFIGGALGLLLANFWNQIIIQRWGQK